MSQKKLQENRQHGTVDFPLEYYLVDSSHPRYQMPLHWHSETELLYIQKGRFLLSLDSREYTLEEGDFCYISGTSLHGGTPQDCIYECLCFNSDSLLKHSNLVRDYLTDVENNNTLIQPVFTNADPEILKCTSHMFAAIRAKKPGWELLTLAGLYDFYGTIIQKNYRKTPLDSLSFQRMRQIKLALEYIEQHFQEQITLEELSRAAGLSPKYFCRYFKSTLHKTPIDYLNHYRIVRARQLLETNQLSIMEVAVACSYHDLSYFVRCFKKYTGITPNQYSKLSQFQKITEQ